MSAVAALIGLVFRTEKLKTIRKFPSMRGTSSMFMSPEMTTSTKTTSFLETHSVVTLITVGCTYYCAVCMIVGNVITTATSYSTSNATTEVPDILKSAIIVSDGVCMILHITTQGFLMRSTNRSNNKLRQVFAFLMLANLSIWMLEVNQICVKFHSFQGSITLDMLPPIFMSLNRFYSAILFTHFWRTK